MGGLLGVGGRLLKPERSEAQAVCKVRSLHLGSSATRQGRRPRPEVQHDGGHGRESRRGRTEPHPPEHQTEPEAPETMTCKGSKWKLGGAMLKAKGFERRAASTKAQASTHAPTNFPEDTAKHLATVLHVLAGRACTHRGRAWPRQEKQNRNGRVRRTSRRAGRERRT